MAVVVLDVLMDDGFEMSATEDEHPVQTFTPHGADERLGEGVGTGARTGGRTTRGPAERKTPSKLAVTWHHDPGPGT